MATIRFKNEQGEWEEANAPKLEIPVKINGVEFDGSKDINIEEIQVSKTQPTSSNIKLWGKVINKINDIDILRQIRDDNPTSVLNHDVTMFGRTIETAWLESRDPLTWWGITWSGSKVSIINFYDYRVGRSDIFSINNINSLKSLTEITTEYSIQQNIILSDLPLLTKAYIYSDTSYNKTLSVANCNNLLELNANGNNFIDIDISNCNSLIKFIVHGNKLTSIPTLLSKGNITDYNFIQNYLPTAELDRFRAMGFTDESKLLPQKMTDLDVLRSIRDANPSSQLPGIWLDSSDPYTQWYGAIWNEDLSRIIGLNLSGTGVSDVSLAKELTFLRSLGVDFCQVASLDLSGMTTLEYLYADNSPLASLNISGCVNLYFLSVYSTLLSSLDLTGLASLSVCSASSCRLSALSVAEVSGLTIIDVSFNSLTQIPTLTSKGNIDYYNFTYNNFPTAELDRFRAMGFTDEAKLLPQNT